MNRLRSIVRPVILVLAAALLSAAAPASSEDLPEEEVRKRALALRVMKVTGATAQGDQVAYGLLGQLRPGYPAVPEEVWGELRSNFALEEIIELSLPIYTRNFDEQELAQLVEFYESPIGQKMIERMPVVMQESTLAFNEWNKAKYAEVMRLLQDKGYEAIPEFSQALKDLGVQVPEPKAADSQ